MWVRLSRSTLSAFRFWRSFVFEKKHFFDFSRPFFKLFFLELVWNISYWVSCGILDFCLFWNLFGRTFDVGFSLRAAISLIVGYLAHCRLSRSFLLLCDSDSSCGNPFFDICWFFSDFFSSCNLCRTFILDLVWIIFNSSFVLEIWVGELFLDYCWGGYLAHFWLHESDSSFGNTYFWHFFDVSRLLYLWNLCTTRVEHDCWRNISFNMRRCRSHDMSSFSHIPKRKIAPSLWTRYMGVGLRTIYQVFNVLNTASATHNYPGCCGTTCARIAMQGYLRHAAWMIGYSFHIS